MEQPKVPRQRPFLNRRRVQSMTVIGGLLAGAGTLLAALAGILGVFDRDAPAPSALIGPGPGSASGPVSPAAEVRSEGASELPPYESFRTLEDESETISVVVPDAWGNIRGNGWYWDPTDMSTRIGPGLNASPNIGAWFTDAATPGLFVGASRAILQVHDDPEELASTVEYSRCVFESGSDYQSQRFTGRAATWVCGDTGARWFHVALWPDDHDYLVMVAVKMIEPRDEIARDRVLESLRVEPLGPDEPTEWPGGAPSSSGSS